MILLSKDILSDIAKCTEALEKTSAVQAARRLPGFDASQDAFKAQHDRDRPAPSPEPPSPAEGPSGGLFTAKTW